MRVILEKILTVWPELYRNNSLKKPLLVFLKGHDILLFSVTSYVTPYFVSSKAH